MNRITPLSALHDLSAPYTARAVAVKDYQDGVCIDDNPYTEGTVCHQVWAEEMARLMHQEEVTDIERVSVRKD